MNNKHKVVKVVISYRNIDSTDALAQHTEDKVRNCVQKFVHHDTEVTVVLSVEKNRHRAEATFNCDGHQFRGEQESDDMYASVDGLVNSLSQQLRRHKEKMTSHH